MGLVRNWDKSDKFYSVDPGKDHYAWALWDGTKLHSCGLERNVDHSQIGLLYLVVQYLVIEKMVIYPGVRAEDPNDLLCVAFISGQISASFGKYRLVEARTWKGQVSKEITKQRVIQILGSDPCAGMPKKDSNHVYDAIGIGLWWQGRYK